MRSLFSSYLFIRVILYAVAKNFGWFSKLPVLIFFLSLAL